MSAVTDTERVQAEMARLRALAPWERAQAVSALAARRASVFAVLAEKYREPQS